MTDQIDAAKLTSLLVSTRCGLVRKLSAQFRGPEEPCPPYLWNATLADLELASPSAAMHFANGKGLTDAAAQLSALGEAVERYAAVYWDTDRVRLGHAHLDAITPDDCVLYSDEQYSSGLIEYEPWSNNTKISWISGQELPSGKSIEMPASLVYLTHPPVRAEDKFTAITSNGLAAGKDLNQALLSGMYEVIERDVFMITWLNKLPAKEIITPESHCNAAHVIRHYRRFGVKVRLLSLYTDQAACVVMAIAQDPRASGVALMVGLGCDINPIAAVDKAVFELCQLRPGITMRRKTEPLNERLNCYEGVRGIEDHPMFHAMHEHTTESDFLFDGDVRCRLEDLERATIQKGQTALDTIVEKAVSNGSRVAYVDITPPDIEQLGLKAVRVIITGLQPIHFGFSGGRFGGSRLFSAPLKWGLRKNELNPADLNACPHPLA